MSVLAIISGIIGLTALLVLLYIANERDKEKLEQTLNHPDITREYRKGSGDDRMS